MSEDIKQMSDDELVAACMEEMARGIGGGLDSENDSEISLPLDYYFGRLPGISKRTAKDKNASRYVSMDVMDGVEATVSEIMPAFTTSEIGIYEPSGQDDEEQAETETALVNYLFFEQYDGYSLIQELLKDTLLHRNCTAKAYWDERAVVEYETFDNVPALALQQLLQPNKENQQVEVVHQEVDGAQQAQPQSQEEEMMIHGGMIEPAIEETFNIKIKRTTIVGKPVIEAIAPEEVIVSGDHTSPYLHDARFVAHEKIETVSSMIEQGFDPKIVRELPEYNSNIESLSRSRESEEFDYSSSHESTKLIRVFECYILIDFDGDGIAERRKVVIGDGNTLLSNDEWDNVALIGGVATLVPHKYKGVSLFDRLKEIQDTKTPLIRSMVDGTQLATQTRIGVVTGEVNLDDLLTSRTGGVVRMENANSVIPFPNPEIPQSSYQLLGLMDSQRKERGGSAVGTASQAMAISGDTAHGIERVMSSMELGNAVIARSIGETVIRGIFIELHNILRTNYKGELNAKIGGQWVKSVPSEWQTRANVSIQIGSSHAERNRQANVMREVVTYQEKLAATGSVMFDEGKTFKAIGQIMKLSGIKSPELYFIDPNSDEGKQKSQQKSQQSQQAQQEQKELQDKMAQAQSDIANAEMMKGQAALDSQYAKVKIEGMKQELDRMKALVDAANKADEMQFNYDKLASDESIKLTEMELAANKDLSPQLEDNK